MILKNALHEHNLELIIKATNDVEVAGENSVYVAEVKIVDLKAICIHLH